VWRILKRLGLNRLPASQRYQRRALRWKRYEKQRLGRQLQVDVKFIEPLGQTGRRRTFYQFTDLGRRCHVVSTNRRPMVIGPLRTGMPADSQAAETRDDDPWTDALPGLMPSHVSHFVES
jgi:hypothetical protein